MDYGVKFPFRIAEKHGRVAISGEKENIKESVKIILLTEPGERRMHPEFGTKLRQFLFEPLDSQVEAMISREIIHSLTMWEQRITDIAVTVLKEPAHRGILQIQVRYRIQKGGGEDSMHVLVE